MFSGSIVALVTPFSDREIDETALAGLVRHHLDNGTTGIVPVGTTGESPTLDNREHARVVDIVVQEVAGQVPVIAGAGSNSIAEAIEHTRKATLSGADGVLHVTGYYNRPSQEGIIRHFERLNAGTQLPIIVYNVPPRTIVDIVPETLARLAMLDQVAGVKDATGDLSRPLLESALINKHFCYLTGEDMTAVAYNANGGNGCISVTANVAPALCSHLQIACAQGNFTEALAIQRRLLPLHRALFMEPSPAGIKYACSLLGLCSPDCRLPMVELQQGTRRAIEQAMQALDLLDPAVAA